MNFPDKSILSQATADNSFTKHCPSRLRQQKSRPPFNSSSARDSKLECSKSSDIISYQQSCSYKKNAETDKQCLGGSAKRFIPLFKVLPGPSDYNPTLPKQQHIAPFATAPRTSSNSAQGVGPGAYSLPLPNRLKELLSLKYKQHKLKQQAIYLQMHHNIAALHPAKIQQKPKLISKQQIITQQKPIPFNYKLATRKYLPKIYSEPHKLMFEGFENGFMQKFNNVFVQKNDQVYCSYIQKDNTLEPGIYDKAYRKPIQYGENKNAVFKSSTLRNLFKTNNNLQQKKNNAKKLL